MFENFKARSRLTYTPLLSEENKRELRDLYKEEARLKANISRIIEAAMFAIEPSNGYALFEDYQRWTWDIPNDGQFHVDPKWPTTALKIGTEDFQRGFRSCHMRPANGIDADWPAHFHPDACEDIGVLTGQIDVIIDESVISLRAGNSIRIPAGKAHTGRMTNGSVAILSYQRFGQCEDCLHNRGLPYQVFPACGR